MSSLAALFFSLSPVQRRSVHLQLGRQALRNWEVYARTQGEMRYVESVAGTPQVVDSQLPRDALASVQAGQDLAGVAERYLEPIAALQDDDLIFPDSTEFAYYALYNLYQKYVQQQEIKDWLIVNQALASEEDPKKWYPMLQRSIEQAMREAA